MDQQPPKWVFQFLEKTCSSKYLDELQGDLLELYYRDLGKVGPKRAAHNFMQRALLSPRLYRLPDFFHSQSLTMHRSYFKVAFRHANKHRSATFIHFFGLMLGLAAAFYIGLFIKNELSFDQMHEKRDNLYRVLRMNPETGVRNQGTSSRHGAALKEQNPFITMCRYGNDPVKIGDIDPVLVDEFYWSDSTFFEMFTFSFVHGDPFTCLDQVNSLVITKSLSMQLFGTDNSLGKSIKVKVYDGNQEYLMKVTGIVEDPSKYTHIQFQALGSMANAEDLYASLVPSWGFSWVRTYIHVPDNRIREIESGMPDLIEKYFGDDPPNGFGMDFQAFNDVYLHSQDIPRNTLRGNIKNLKIFAAIGVLILLVSIMNYVNLSTARAVTRSKEVGIRKVLGSKKMAIIWQFIIESVLFTLVGGAAAIALLWFALPKLNLLFDLDLSFQVFNVFEWVGVVITTIILGIIAGFLPSLVMAKLPTLSNNKPSIQFKPGKWSFTRKFFVGVQYLVTLVLLVATLVIFKQYQYLKNFDLGFDSSQLLHLAVDDRVVQHRLDLLKERMSKVPGVTGVSVTGEDLPSALNNTWGLFWQGLDPETPMAIDIVSVDENYFDLLGIEFLEGNNFIQNYEIDSARTVILNEKAKEVIGWESLAGKQIEIGNRQRTVAGVVQNHHNTTLHSQIVPIAYFIFPPGFRVSADNLLIRIETQNLSSILTQLEDVWKEFSTDPFEHNFVDEAFAAAYNSERRFSSLVSTFTIIAIAISMIGLFGLINFIIQLKLKEIGIRRILGANQMHLLGLLGKDFFIVFAVSALFALPIAYYFMGSWLDNYAYRIQMNGLMIFWAVFVCLSISLLVILFHLQRTARINPTEVINRE